MYVVEIDGRALTKALDCAGGQQEVLYADQFDSPPSKTTPE